MKYSSLKELVLDVLDVCSINAEGITVKDINRLRSKFIDILVYNSVFNNNPAIQEACRWIIWEIARLSGIKPSSIQTLYSVRGRGECSGFTVPAINIRGLTYDVARAVTRASIKNKVNAFIFEIARSEIEYTCQRPGEYTTVILGAALREGFTGYVFVQGDHFQFSARKFREKPDAELKAVKELTEEAINAGFYNIDIDSSTLVDLSKTTITEQQMNNFNVASEMAAFMRSKQPQGVNISVGAEIGEVGGKNSTPEELRGFMDGFIKSLQNKSPGANGISKISVQTGTSHGGVVLPDGSIAQVKLDFDTLKRLSYIARTEYGLCGAVQHGASTLPPSAFGRFPETETAEVHLATEFQNMIYEHPSFPKDMKDEIYEYLKKECAQDAKPQETEEQFFYKTRKKAFGPFKEKLWNMPEKARDAISNALEEKFEFLFQKLNVINTKDLVRKYITAVDVRKPLPEGLQAELEGREYITKSAAAKSSVKPDYHIDEIGE